MSQEGWQQDLAQMESWVRAAIPEVAAADTAVVAQRRVVVLPDLLAQPLFAWVAASVVSWSESLVVMVCRIVPSFPVVAVWLVSRNYSLRAISCHLLLGWFPVEVPEPQS